MLWCPEKRNPIFFMSSKILPLSPASYHFAAPILKNGGLVILPTDTLYGIVTSALIPKAVERVFQLRKRNRDKAVIILISDQTGLEQFSIELDERGWDFLRSVWPGKVTVALPTTALSDWDHLHRGTNSIAFRVPANDALCNLLKQTGPLIAPSANIAGLPPATTITAAQEYFGDQVDLYIDGGVRESHPSTLVSWTPEGVTLLREGAVNLNIQQESV